MIFLAILASFGYVSYIRFQPIHTMMLQPGYFEINKTPLGVGRLADPAIGGAGIRLMLNVTNEGSVKLTAVTALLNLVNPILIGTCDGPISPSKVTLCEISGVVDCSNLAIGPPYTVLFIGRYADGSTDKQSFDLIPQVVTGSC